MNVLHPEVVEEEPTVEIGDVYGTGDGNISMTLRSNVGIKEVRYKVGEDEVVLGFKGEKEVTIEIPENATNIRVIDIIAIQDPEPEGTDITEEIPSGDEMPSISDPQTDEDGNTRVTSEEELYYTGEDGQPHELPIVRMGRVVAR